MRSDKQRLVGIIPSASSTDEPCRTVYGSTGSLPSSFDMGVAESVELLERQAKSDSSGDLKLGIAKNVLWRHHRQLVSFMAILCCVVPAFLMSSVLFVRKHETSNGWIDEPIPFSKLDPVNDLKLFNFIRPEASSPPKALLQAKKAGSALPTNAWYQNMILARGEPSNVHRVYSLPYVLDAIGPIPGLRVHENHIDSGTDVMQLSFSEKFGITVGAAGNRANGREAPHDSHEYSVLSTTELGLTIQWDIFKMKSSIVRGMPYVTMSYENVPTADTINNVQAILPTVASPLGLGVPPVVDATTNMPCTPEGNPAKAVEVQRDVELFFHASDFSWLVFFSEPVFLQCVSSGDDGPTYLQVAGRVDETSANPLVVRVALLESCTTGQNTVSCTKGLGHRVPKPVPKDMYANLLRHHANLYPGENSSIEYKIDSETGEADLRFLWDARSMAVSDGADDLTSTGDSSPIPLLMFALPHHLDKLNPNVLPERTLYCTSSLIGPTCLVKGSTWTIKEKLPNVGFRAPRPPRAGLLPTIADAMKGDIDFSLPEYYQRGAGDTYFSGKMLAKLARIILVADEIDELCSAYHPMRQSSNDLYWSACNDSTLPSKRQLSDAVDRLRSGVEIWINGTAETPFVYDPAWGGVVSCGCYFDGKVCSNTAPDCPAFYDQGLNFGNGFYNDMHFHYGYHIYAAAVVARFDPDWARRHFEQVLLLVRNIANPSKDDTSFTLFRHKDWFQGSSWASGVPLPPYLNGKNQESSSEAIAAYEAVSLYGKAMVTAWESAGNKHMASVANEIRNVGELMTATELRSAQRYWHVLQNDESRRIYPKIYERHVVGIMWSTMAQFGTWFGAAPHLAYGIQLLPLTPISEARDDLAWANEVYPVFAKSCMADFSCTTSGWMLLQLSVLATIGYSDLAATQVEHVPEAAYLDAGGNGHSKTNTLWYIATRPEVADPIAIEEPHSKFGLDKLAASFELKDCSSPTTCTADVLDQMAGAFSCRDRIAFLMKAMGKSEWDACFQVSEIEFPDICGPCNPTPNASNSTTSVETVCPKCTQEQCDSDLNRCPRYERTFVCAEGASMGGCSGNPFDLDGDIHCDSCCELSGCQRMRDNESPKIMSALGDKSNCPPCDESICWGELNRCIAIEAPYLCVDGPSVGGCSGEPWQVQSTSNCHACCSLTHCPLEPNQSTSESVDNDDDHESD